MTPSTARVVSLFMSKDITFFPNTYIGNIQSMDNDNVSFLYHKKEYNAPRQCLEMLYTNAEAYLFVADQLKHLGEVQGKRNEKAHQKRKSKGGHKVEHLRNIMINSITVDDDDVFTRAYYDMAEILTILDRDLGEFRPDQVLMDATVNMADLMAALKYIKKKLGDAYNEYFRNPYDKLEHFVYLLMVAQYKTQADSLIALEKEKYDRP